MGPPGPTAVLTELLVEWEEANREQDGLVAALEQVVGKGGQLQTTHQGSAGVRFLGSVGSVGSVGNNSENKKSINFATCAKKPPVPDHHPCCFNWLVLNSGPD